MKTFLAILAALAILIGLSACNGKEKPNGAPELAGKPEPLPSDKAAEAKKPLIVYFSCTGNTRRVAELIAGETGGALFEIEVSEPYTEADLNWRDPESRVNKQHQDPALQDMELKEKTAADWDSYDTVFIGYPIWYGEAPWAVTTFVKANDFGGKIVIPFCTSTHVGLGQSGSLLERAAGKGDWKEGIRFEEQPEESAVREWVQSVM
ncbi:MAG: flavodoxin [Abditibacteriota bacterium]|nr:flavodoxin [Abditibacteriota bacterium]